MSRFALTSLALSLSLTIAGCGLVIDPSRHQRSGVDSGTPMDAAVDAAATDASTDSGSVDAGTDASFDAGPPECADDMDCGLIGTASCVMGRCTVCVPTTRSVVDVHTAPDLLDRFDLVIGTDGDAAEIGLAWRGMGTRLYVHRTPLGAPAAPSSVTSVTDALGGVSSGLRGINAMLSASLTSRGYDRTNRYFGLAVSASDVSGATYRGWALYAPGAMEPITSNTYPDTDRLAPPDAVLAGLAWTETTSAIGSIATVSRARVGGAVRLETHESAYGNLLEMSPPTFGVPTAPVVAIETDGPLVMVDDATDRTSVLMRPSFMRGPAELLTADRTGDASVARVGGDTYLIAYPSSAEIAIRGLGCTGTCLPMSGLRTDIRTGAAEVLWARVVMAGTIPVVLSGERTSSGARVVLRALRPDLSPLSVPGGGTALVIAETSDPGTFLAGRIASATDSTGARHLVPGWMASGGASTDRVLRISSFRLGCGM